MMRHTRTIRAAADYIREQDPETAVTETAIRTLVRGGKIPSARVGHKYLVTLEAVDAYLAGQKRTGVLETTVRRIK